jgi:hypothetical protein
MDAVCVESRYRRDEENLLRSRYRPRCTLRRRPAARNDYRAGLFNGGLGRITAIDIHASTLFSTMPKSQSGSMTISCSTSRWLTPSRATNARSARQG